uniref:HMG box domain-containing protein n=1 Tax=Aureoumbra lagunensis TaxID=44058 RepID=A0A7S3K3K5_9STRA|mmetsp:Transcript_2706/g.3705  ORF Transcript_2706/g.3705 Transcript_2706/m.3705 type:complete len:386 (+) Transcript_2706:263-1420(+)|eukprot:CAMPEP_0197286228 /NCGR_PEP_ID=MMETSP0890-20130614/1694_1 /TAXON_ID=44058 ORGANISM="Aureoumbra lagunensis, Strain CCMP1510" /NCGR_SAMPLE_ID=MMETSP0890 /ASSEMBLY_ACC=CAM_ASM_000533 /LENGTH=385 /DNA_ID=CAMNT_0042754443 /DNA_START=161 /DNA_END=1318 /DNA_ORIENTATION=-
MNQPYFGYEFDPCLEGQPPSLSFHVPLQPMVQHGHPHLHPQYAQHLQYQMVQQALPREKGQRRGVRRNPDAPKRPMSPYVTFVKEKWKEVHDSLPGAAAKDVMRTLGEQWNALSDSQKEKWKNLSDEDKARYASEMQAFEGPSTVAVIRRGHDGARRKRNRKDPNAPKRGASAFLLFANEKRKALKDANPTLHNTEISRMLGAIWKTADDTTKAPYVQAEAEARKEYGKAMEEYRAQGGGQQQELLSPHIQQHHLALSSVGTTNQSSQPNNSQYHQSMQGQPQYLQQQTVQSSYQSMPPLQQHYAPQTTQYHQSHIGPEMMQQYSQMQSLQQMQQQLAQQAGGSAPSMQQHFVQRATSPSSQTFSPVPGPMPGSTMMPTQYKQEM